MDEPIVPTSAVSAAPDGLALPRDFDARYGDGLRLGVCLGGGGLFFVAWQLSYLHEMAERGIDLARAERVVGTSAGALVAAILTAHRLNLLRRELEVLAKFPRILAMLAASGLVRPSQARALQLFHDCADADPVAIRTIGHAALAAQAPPASVMPRNLGLILASCKWPSPGLHVTCVDTYSGERCVITEAANIGIGRAMAASSAVPGLFAPQQIGDRRCMDGGVSGSGTHLDLLAGAERVVVLALTDGTGLVKGMMTTAPGATEAELAALHASGTKVFRRVPATVDPVRLMDPEGVPEAIEMGERQADADADELQAFLA